MITTCQFIGHTQSNYPFTMCGSKCQPGVSYCAEHVHVVYKTGTSINTSSKIKERERELAMILSKEDQGRDD